ncbi:unnamed protein product [Anisakis simplex]|uniref:Deoxyhypusine synthase (inferred by orthology to a human protein) n=1 Tax=Anisakis simplex TaxID=6269 RepID=A0A0M3IZR3_ANISI|nr:unnamed protein product [Anisakis simplex]
MRCLLEHELVDCLVTSAGGVEEDLIKCLTPSYIGAFELDVEWTASKLSAGLAAQINDASPICYWASHNNIPTFCPSLTDGSLGDMLYFDSVRKDGLNVDY